MDFVLTFFISLSSSFTVSNSDFNFSGDRGSFLVSKEEIARLCNSDCGTFYILKPSLPKFQSDSNQLIKGDYSSKDCLISKSELNKILHKFNYFKS